MSAINACHSNTALSGSKRSIDSVEDLGRSYEKVDSKKSKTGFLERVEHVSSVCVSAIEAQQNDENSFDCIARLPNIDNTEGTMADVVGSEEDVDIFEIAKRIR